MQNLSDAAPKEIRREFEQNIKVLTQHKNSLNEYLVQLDDSKKVSCDDPRNKALAKQAEAYVYDILHHVEQLNPRFQNTFLESGSFYDEVKVGLPDEYDYMAKLELLSKPGIGRAVETKLGFARVILEDEEAIGLWKDFLCNDTDDDGKVYENVLMVSEIRNEFSSLIMKATKSVAIPTKWQRDPCPKNHGPCSMLEFLVEEFLEEGLLYISIDLAPCITYPSHKSVEFPFYNFLKDGGYASSFLEQCLSKEPDVLLVPFTLDAVRKISQDSPWHYFYREQMRVSFSLLEKGIFGQFSSDSVEKRLIRILKILRDSHLRDEGVMEEWETPLPEGVFPDYPPGTSMKNVTVERIAPVNLPELPDPYVRTDGEITINKAEEGYLKDLLQTYAFKSLFFYAKLKPDNKDCWLPSNLSGLVLKCLQELFDIYSVPQSSVPSFFFNGSTGGGFKEHTREKTVRRLLKIVRHLKEQISIS